MYRVLRNSLKLHENNENDVDFTHSDLHFTAFHHSTKVTIYTYFTLENLIRNCLVQCYCSAGKRKYKLYQFYCVLCAGMQNVIFILEIIRDITPVH